MSSIHCAELEKKRRRKVGNRDIRRVHWGTANSSFLLQAEISKRLNAIIGQILPFLSQEHQQQVATAVDRAKQVTMTELNSIIGVSAHHAP